MSCQTSFLKAGAGPLSYSESFEELGRKKIYFKNIKAIPCSFSTVLHISVIPFTVGKI